MKKFQGNEERLRIKGRKKDRMKRFGEGRSSEGVSSPHRCIRQTRRKEFRSLVMRMLLEWIGGMDWRNGSDLSRTSQRVKFSESNEP
jgi:hypothetical protein